MMRRRHFVHILQKYLLKQAHSLKGVGLQYKIPSFDPRLFFVLGQTDTTVGVFTTHTDGISGCGSRGILDRARKFLELRSGPLELQGSEFAPVGLELSQGSGFSVQLTQ